MKILICDDDIKSIDTITNMLNKTAKTLNLSFTATTYNSGERLLLHKEKYDIAFIDIEMPKINGLTVTKHLQSINPNIIVFIVTSFHGYLDDAMDLKVFRFLSKPIDENRFLKSMEIALNLYHQNTEAIVLDKFDEHHTIFTTDILYLTIENRKTRVITKHGEYLLNQKFDYWKSRLNAYGYFAQSHYSFIVNLKNVTDFNKKEIIISSGSDKIKVPLSRNYYQNFKNSFYEYMGGTV